MGDTETIEASEPPKDRGRAAWRDRRVLAFAGCCAGLAVALFGPLGELFSLARKEEIHSHILLIPLVSIYLTWQQAGTLPAQSRPSWGGAIVFGLLALAVFLLPRITTWEAAGSDRSTLWAAVYVLLVVASGFACLGGAWMKRLAFPFAFLVFMVPLPGAWMVGIEQFLMVASAEVAHWFFQWSGTPVYRDGQVMELPGMTFEVAQECSGIRSSYVLFITSLLASYMFLRKPGHRILLVAAVIPLGIVRNALRVLVIGLLCVHKGPHMIDHWIHHRGGPVFFALSLVPLFLLAGWLYLRENPRKKGSDSSSPQGQNA